MSYKRPTISVNGKQFLLSRYTAEKFIGRRLSSDEIVHHIDGNPFNNSIENLMVVSRAEHKKIHGDIGKETRLKKKYHFDDNAILKMYISSRMTTEEIALNCDCSQKTIERILKPLLAQMGLKMKMNRRGSKEIKHEHSNVASG